MGQVDNLAFIISKAGYSSVRAITENPKTGFGTPIVINLQSQEFVWTTFQRPWLDFKKKQPTRKQESVLPSANVFYHYITEVWIALDLIIS